MPNTTPQPGDSASSLRSFPSIAFTSDTILFLDSSPAYDLLESLRLLTHPPIKGRWQEWSRQKIAWLESQPMDLFQEIRRWFAGSYPLGMATLALIPLLSQPGRVTAFLARLAELPLTDFLRLAVVFSPTHLDTPLDAPTLLSLQTSTTQARAFIDRYLRFTGKQRAHLLQVLQNPEDARSTLLITLQRYHEQIYASLEEQLQEEREQATRRLEAELSTDSPLRAAITRKYELREFSPIIVSPSLFLQRPLDAYIHEIHHSLFDVPSYEPFILRVAMPHESLLRPGRGRAPVPPPVAGEAVEQWAHLFSTLADPSRLRLLHLLATRPHYQQELAAALNLSGATISHHLAPLRDAGLIRLERRAHRTYLILQSSLLQEQLQESVQFLLRQHPSQEEQE